MSNNKNILYVLFRKVNMKLKLSPVQQFLYVMSVLNCMDIIKEENKDTFVKHQDSLPSPREICSVLDDYVIGQSHAKRFICCGSQSL